MFIVIACVGKNLALLQAEASACGFGLANVPNVRWLLLHGLSQHETQRPGYMRLARGFQTRCDFISLNA
jgi:hypothetical protein